MASLTETMGASSFIKTLNTVFGINNTRLVDTDDAFSVFLDLTGANPNLNVMVGRFCKRTLKGVVMDRRGEYDDDNFGQGTQEAPRRREADAGASNKSS